jgi:hypothetical protein
MHSLPDSRRKSCIDASPVSSARTAAAKLANMAVADTKVTVNLVVIAASFTRESTQDCLSVPDSRADLD